MASLQVYQSDVLFLLIGANPLPNYVAARLLTRRKARVYLLHTGAPNPTLSFAKHLRDLLARQRPDLQCILSEIDRVDGHAIEGAIAGLVRDMQRDTRVGIHYTGGTKPMSVHAYHALRDAFPSGVFSYLDPKALALILRRGASASDTIFVGQDIQDLTLPGLFGLHGYAVMSSSSQAAYSELALALAKVHETKAGQQAWYGYRRRKAQESLPTREAGPELAPVIEVFNAWGGTPEAVAAHMGFAKLASCAHWFKGAWLEFYAYSCLMDVASDLGITSYGCNFKLKLDQVTRTPEIDIAALLGYQLYGISCIASDQPDPVKYHLFEVYGRVHQVGGGEAWGAVVSYYDAPGELEEQLSTLWSANIRVFGREHLAQLDDHLYTWISEASRL